MKVFITGAFGNIGSLVMEKLLEQQCQIIAFDLKTPVNEQIATDYAGRVTTVWGDICDADSVRPHINDVDAVIHLAAVLPPFTEDNPARAEKINVGGTRQLLALIQQSGNQPVFIFASSFAVYGHRQQETPPRTVEDSLQATDHYSQHKIECEALIQAQPLPWVILRLGACIDSRRRHNHKAAIKMSFDTQPHNRIEYVHPADVATAIVHAIERKAAHRRILLIGGGKDSQVTQIELMNTLFGAAGIQFREKDFGSDPFYTDWMDTTESQRILEFQQHSFDDLKREAHAKMRTVRFFVRPISPLVRSAFLSWLYR